MEAIHGSRLSSVIASLIRVGSSPTPPATVSDDDNPLLARLYLVDHGWRDPNRFGLVLAQPGCTLRALVAAAAESVRADDDAAGRRWTLEVPPRDARIIVEDGQPRFPMAAAPTRAQAPVAIAPGVGDASHESAPAIDAGAYSTTMYALNEDTNVTGTKIISPDTPLSEIPPSRPLLWTWHNSGRGMMRCLSVLSEGVAQQVNTASPTSVLHSHPGTQPA